MLIRSVCSSLCGVTTARGVTTEDIWPENWKHLLCSPLKRRPADPCYKTSASRFMNEEASIRNREFYVSASASNCSPPCRRLERALLKRLASLRFVVMAKAPNPSTPEVKAGGGQPQVQGQPDLYSEFPSRQGNIVKP